MVEIETEAYQTLLARAQRRMGRVPPELIARHILSVTRGADWPVQRDALEALLRRFARQRGARRSNLCGRPRRRRQVAAIRLRPSRLAAIPPLLIGRFMEHGGAVSLLARARSALPVRWLTNETGLTCAGSARLADRPG
jgi:hypothetical protein